MPDKSLSWKKRVLWIAGGCLSFTLLFIVAVRVTVNEMFRTIETSKATGLSAVGLDSWFGRASVDFARISGEAESRIARTADLRTRSSSFDRSETALHQIVARHRGYFEDLRTESRSGSGRSLAAAVSLPSDEFEGALSDLQNLGRVETISQAGEDSAVQIANATRRLSAAQNTLARLQKLQRERQGALRDAVALEKDIAQADEAVANAERQHRDLLSTVAQAHIRFVLLEDYRAPLQVSMAGAALQVRNALVEGIGATFSTIALILSVIFSYGLPLMFWLALLFWPVRTIWRCFHRTPLPIAGA